MAGDESRAQRIVRYGAAAALGLSILALTYVLFDPDLGTELPLFGEITCRGRLDVVATNGFGGEFLQLPASGVTARATADGEPQAVLFEMFLRREPAAPWQRFHDQVAPGGEHTFYVTAVTEQTEAYVSARHLEGKVCAGESSVLQGRAEDVESPRTS